MQRLLADAQKLSGQKYDLDNLGDVYEAIHVIQEDLGLTGVAAAEASETFTGSFEAMKAAATNLMAAITSGNIDSIYDYIIQLFDSVETFVFKNLAPMVGRLVSKLPQLLANLMAEIGDLFKNAASSTDMAGGFVSEFLTDLVAGFFQSLPVLIDGFISFIVSAVESLLTFDWLGLLSTLADTLISYLDEGFYEIGAEDTSLLDMMLNWVNNTLPHLAKEAITMVLTLVNGLISGLPKLVETAAPMIASFIAGLAKNFPKIIETGFKLITQLIVGLINAIPKLVVSLGKIVLSIVDAFDDYDWKTLGMNILEGIGKGITSAVKSVVEAAKKAAKAIFDSVKEFFNIGSPSKLMKDEIGKWIPAGIAVGIETNADSVTKAMNDLGKNTVTRFDNALFGTSFSPSQRRNDDFSQLLGAINANQTNITVKLEGDAQKLFRSTISSNNDFRKRTGISAFA